MVVDNKLLSILVCPQDRGPLLLVIDERLREERGSAERLREERGSREWLYNPRLRRAYRIEDGIPVLLIDEAVTVDDEAEHQRMLERAGSAESG